MLQTMRLQRVGYDLASEQQQHRFQSLLVLSLDVSSFVYRVANPNCYIVKVSFFIQFGTCQNKHCMTDSDYKVSRK